MRTTVLPRLQTALACGRVILDGMLTGPRCPLNVAERSSAEALRWCLRRKRLASQLHCSLRSSPHRLSKTFLQAIPYCPPVRRGPDRKGIDNAGRCWNPAGLISDDFPRFVLYWSIEISLFGRQHVWLDFAGQIAGMGRLACVPAL